MLPVAVLHPVCTALIVGFAGAPAIVLIARGKGLETQPEFTSFTVTLYVVPLVSPENVNVD